MRLYLTAMFIGIGLIVSEKALADQTSICVLRLDPEPVFVPARPTCTQLEKLLKIDPVACGIYAPGELAQIKLAEDPDER